MPKNDKMSFLNQNTNCISDADFTVAMASLNLNISMEACNITVENTTTEATETTSEKKGFKGIL